MRYVLTTAAFLSMFAACSTTPATGTALPQYTVKISLERTVDGKKHILSAPRVTVVEGQQATVTVEGEAASYRFYTRVTREAGVPTATTSALFAGDGSTLITPRVTQHVGNMAFVITGEFTMTVLVEKHRV